MRCKSCGQDNPLGARFCANCGANLVAAVQPFSVIGVGSAYSNGWRQLWKYFLELFLIGIIGFIISIPTGMGGWAQGAAAGGILSFLGFLKLGDSVLQHRDQGLHEVLRYLIILEWKTPIHHHFLA